MYVEELRDLWNRLFLFFPVSEIMVAADNPLLHRKVVCMVQFVFVPVAVK